MTLYEINESCMIGDQAIDTAHLLMFSTYMRGSTKDCTITKRGLSKNEMGYLI